MSSTRYAAEGSAPRQERFASDPEYSGAINALLAAKRIALVDDVELQAVLWYIQFRSLKPLGLKALADELIAHFPERIGSPTMRRIRCQPGKEYGAKVVREIRDEIPDAYLPLKGDVIENWGVGKDEIVAEPALYRGETLFEQVRESFRDLPDHLTALCLDPAIELSDSKPEDYGRRTAAVWYFENLLDGLKRYRAHRASAALAAIADTEVSERVQQTLHFCFRRRRMVLIEGNAGVGKSATVKAWCDQYQGLVRYVEIPSSNDDRSFYVAIAEALGVARGSAYNGQQIKLRVEEALRASGLMLVLDEAQFAWPQKYSRPQGVPTRMQWIKTAFDSGTPIALVGLPEFSQWQELYVKKTLWRDSQFVRRTNRHIRLPEVLSQDDLMKITKAVHPKGDAASWNLLAGCAEASLKKQASAITETFISALDLAEEDGRSEVTYDDIEAAVSFAFPSSEEPAVTMPAPSKKRAAVSLHPRCKTDAEAHAGGSSNGPPKSGAEFIFNPAASHLARATRDVSEDSQFRKAR
ncbi:MAG: AAA family ATPase [Chthoniobacterales bacterium]